MAGMNRRTTRLVPVFIVLALFAHAGAAPVADSAEEKIAAARKLLQSTDDAQRKEGEGALKDLLAELTPAADEGKDAGKLLLLARAYLALGDADKANPAIDKAIALQPKSADAHRWKGIALEEGDDLDGAVKEITKATELAPKQAENFYELGQALARGKKNDEALAAFRKAAQVDPKHAKALLMAGAMLTEMGKESEALEQFKKAAAADSTYEMAWRNVGQLYQNQGKPAQAVEAFRTVVKLHPGDVNTLAKIVQCDEAMGKARERDADRAALFEVFKAGKVEEPFYCRDQFAVGTVKIMVFEYFELDGAHALRYSFNVMEKDGKKVKCQIGLGTTDVDTQIAREQGAIGKGERMFSLDAEYPDGEHRTYGLFTKEPTYDDVKKRVTGIIKGEVKPSASSTPGR
jgi:tetratricopeptide (TPR) repeat protein